VKSILKDSKYVVGAVYASGTATVKGPTTGVDTLGYNKVTCVLTLAAIATGATTSFKLQQSDTAVDDAGFVDVTSATATTIADDDDDQLRIIEFQPTKRYVRGLLTKDASNAVGAAWHFILSQADAVPVTQPTGVEGTFVN
jgi:hypothetical protein